MKKIGLVTIYDVPNYGTVLQAYATKRIFENMGCEVTTIQYTRKNAWVRSRYLMTKSCFLKNFIHRLQVTHYGRMVVRLEKFRRQYLSLSKKYDTLEELKKENWMNYDMLVSGSDQVWNAKFLYGDSVYLLSFLSDDIRRISVASSFALPRIPHEYVEKYKLYLQKYDAISVRETNGKKIIEKQLGIDKKVQVLLDPTLMLSAREWIHDFSVSTVENTERYILFYMLDYAFEPKPYIFEVAKFFKRKLKCNVYALVGYKHRHKANGLKLKNFSDASISQYLHLFQNAALVITSSFHGTAFAVNFGRPLISIVPSNGDDRQTTLLRDLNLLSCIVPVGKPLNEINPYYDVKVEQNLLDKKRMESLKWICKNVIGNE